MRSESLSTLVAGLLRATIMLRFERERVERMRVEAEWWCDRHDSRHGFNRRAPKQDFRELNMDIAQQTIDVSSAERYYVGDHLVDCPELPSMLNDTRGQERYVGARATMREGHEAPVRCLRYDRTTGRVKSIERG